MFTDFHAYSGFTEFSKPAPNYKNDRFMTQCRTLEHILSEAVKSHSPVIFGGDLFHTRQKVPVFDFNKIYAIFAKYNQVPIYLLQGNHDMVNNQMGSESSIDTFGFLSNIEVIKNPATRKVAPNLKVYFMPYGEDVKYIKDKLKEFANDAEQTPMSTLLVAHLGINGATINGTQSDSPLMTGDFYPDSFDFIYMGHYHKRQMLDNRSNFIYGGSTLQNSFSDSGESKGYDLLSFEKGQKANDEFMTLDTPRFITLDEWGEQAKAEVAKGNYVRVRIPADQVSQVKESSMDLSHVRTEPVKDFKLNSRIGITADDTPVQVVTKYLKENGLSDLKDLAKSVLGTV